MKAKEINHRVKELVEYMENYDLYSKLFDEIDRDLRREKARERKKKDSELLGKARKH